MIYVIDTSSWQQLFSCYSRERFPSLWAKFDELIVNERITSTREVLSEIERRDKNNGELDWAQTNAVLFPRLSENEMLFFREIMTVPDFQHTVPSELRDPNVAADSFLIARAKDVGGMVITQERERGNRVRIPRICRHFGILCGSLDKLMEQENWRF